MFARSVRVSLAVAALVLVPAAAASAASPWTVVSTPTSQTISSVAYPNGGEVVFVTTAGSIFHGAPQGPYSAATVSPSNASGFTDLAMSPGGASGVAVGPSGTIYRSTDSGATWTQVAGATDYQATPACPGTGNPQTAAPLTDDLYSVQFADSSTVYITGKNRDVLKSTDGGASFTEVNRLADGSCRITVSDDFTDSAWIDGSHGYFISRYFGDYFFTTDGLASSIASRKGEAVNAYTGSVEVALNRGDQTHAWAVTSGAMGGLSFEATVDGGTTWAPPTYDQHNNPLNDISLGGGTVVTVGNSGDIYMSPNGKTFYREAAPAPDAGNDWHAVAVLDSTHAVIGGANGALLFSSHANQQSVVPPPSVPTGSNPTTKSAGGGTVTVFKKVTITGRKGRFIPVVISCKQPRFFVINVLTLTGNHHKAVAYATCHKGRMTVHVGLARSVKTGEYLLSVRIFTLGGHGLAHKVNVAFILV